MLLEKGWDVKKTRKARLDEYNNKYSEIPRDYEERLAWMYDKFHVTDTKAEEILRFRSAMINAYVYKWFTIVLYEDPFGAERPRATICKRNVVSMAKISPRDIHIYSPHAKENHIYMRRVLDDIELDELDQIICTPCVVDMYAYKPTPAYYNTVYKFLAEMGLDRPITKPDWDNIGKAYSDMYNSNVWLDDAFTTDGSVHKYYSILPRVEIKLGFLNMVYNKHQYTNITNRTDFDPDTMNLDYFKLGG